MEAWWGGGLASLPLFTEELLRQLGAAGPKMPRAGALSSRNWVSPWGIIKPMCAPPDLSGAALTWALDMAMVGTCQAGG